MKKRIGSILLLLCLCLTLLPAGAFAAAIVDSGECGKNVTWTLDRDGVLTISGDGTMRNYWRSDSIPWYNFRYFIKIAVIENGVTSIGTGVFRECSSLTSVTIPNSVTSIGGNAFADCSSLTSVTIPDSVTSIGDGAFYGCSSLTSVAIPNSVTSIDGYTFDGCSSLTSVTFPNSITSIGNYAFRECSSLTSLTIPNSVTSIGNSAFSVCSSLTSVTIPDSVTSIGDGAFSGCSSLKNINVDQKNSNYSSVSGVLFTKDKTALIRFPEGRSGRYTIPDSVTRIENGAFHGCSSLTSVIIGGSVASIGNNVFSGCSGLTSVTIPNSVISIAEYAFYNCSSLTSVTIPDGVIYIGNSAFKGCSSLTSVTIPNSVISIGYSAFYGCNSLTSVTIGNSVTSIGDSAFEDCSSLTSVMIPNSVTSIDWYVFSGCSSLTNVTIGNSVTSIGKYAFDGCSSLTSLMIPNSVISIGDDAFWWCDSLTDVFYGGTEAQWNKINFGSNYHLLDATIHYNSGEVHYLTFDPNGGEVESASKMVANNVIYGDLPEPTREGYKFDGWYTSADGGEAVTSDTVIDLSADQTLYAHWTKTDFTVIFDPNGGEIEPPLDKIVTNNETYGDLPEPTREGYKFDGWYTSADGGDAVTPDTVVDLSADQTLYAHWTAKSALAVTFDGAGIGYAVIDINEYGVFESSNVSDSFNWFIDAGDRIEIYCENDEFYTVSATVNGTALSPSDSDVGYCYFVYEAETASEINIEIKSVRSIFNVIFDPNGGEIDPEPGIVTNNGTYGDLPKPTREGYKFDGWYTKKTGGTKITASTKVNLSEDQTLYAHWTRVTYTVTLNANGGKINGKSTAKVTVTNGTKYALPTLTRDGYKFDGWYTSKTDGDKITKSTKVDLTKNQTLYAHWTRVSYTVTLNASGGKINGKSTAKVTVTNGTKYALPTLTRNGYKFDGWYTSKTDGDKITKSTKVDLTKNQTLYAHWTRVSYTVTLNANGGKVEGGSTYKTTVENGKRYGTLPTPTREGYKFDGWYTSKTDGDKITKSTKVDLTENQTLYAHWR